MDSALRIKWQFGGNLDKNNIPSDDMGVYLHLLRGRIVYVGHGNLKKRQADHYTNLKNADCTFFNLRKINEQRITDLYDLICKGRYEESLNAKFLLKSGNVEGLTSVELQEIIEMNLHETSVFYFVTGEKKEAQKIEAGLQWKLIKKFEMDPYDGQSYHIGFRPEERNLLEHNLVIENDFSEVFC